MPQAQRGPVESLGKADALKEILRSLAKRKLPEGVIMHDLNLREEEAVGYLGSLVQGGAVAVDEGGFYCLTPKGRATLSRWEKVDSSIEGTS